MPELPEVQTVVNEFWETFRAVRREKVSKNADMWLMPPYHLHSKSVKIKHR